ncbi:kinase-like protein [Corynespora cassiicola Philippines]|uniref:Kinase-like protein n=1 Tax=Corynespora cassiicola Philippines TaxID=1448308 RepID=A0A2T2N1B5_CORCC|nr:kinase-like protein [Corynespora cassiicola Philippines]
MSFRTASIFRDALLGLKVMHNNGWIHRDIKPPNIGVMPTGAVLLDIGQAKLLKSGCKLHATPGCTGTINYLAPEREMSEYDQLADIWAMGCIGFEMTYGYHPFSFTVNPWRSGKRYEEMRSRFHAKYREAIDKLSADYKKYLVKKTAGDSEDFLHLGDLIVQMLRHPFAKTSHDCGRRINIDEALNHPAWQPLLFDDPQRKRARLN